MTVAPCSCKLFVSLAALQHGNAAGFDLYLTVRDLSKGREVVKDMQASDTAGQGSIQLLEMHLDSLQSVRQCADSFLSQSQQLNILILNAGSCIFLYFIHMGKYSTQDMHAELSCKAAIETCSHTTLDIKQLLLKSCQHVYMVLLDTKATLKCRRNGMSRRADKRRL